MRLQPNSDGPSAGSRDLKHDFWVEGQGRNRVDAAEWPTECGTTDRPERPAIPGPKKKKPKNGRTECSSPIPSTAKPSCALDVAHSADVDDVLNRWNIIKLDFARQWCDMQEKHARADHMRTLLLRMGLAVQSIPPGAKVARAPREEA